MPTPADPNAFARPLAEMEAHIKDAEARGEQLPPQAYALLAKLRELVDALTELSGALGEPARAPDGSPNVPADSGSDDGNTQ